MNIPKKAEKRATQQDLVCTFFFYTFVPKSTFLNGGYKSYELLISNIIFFFLLYESTFFFFEKLGSSNLLKSVSRTLSLIMP